MSKNILTSKPAIIAARGLAIANAVSIDVQNYINKKLTKATGSQTMGLFHTAGINASELWWALSKAKSAEEALKLFKDCTTKNAEILNTSDIDQAVGDDVDALFAKLDELGIFKQ